MLDGTFFGRSFGGDSVMESLRRGTLTPSPLWLFKPVRAGVVG
jgi:hypothetical protein